MVSLLGRLYSMFGLNVKSLGTQADLPCRISSRGVHRTVHRSHGLVRTVVLGSWFDTKL